MDIDPKTYGFDYQTNPRPTVVTAESFAQAGLSALSGQKGPIYDRLILNTAVTDYLLGLDSDPYHAIEQTRVVVDNGQALAHLNRYLEKQ
jgi:anthranilate phosphoribosyltransferase